MNVFLAGFFGAVLGSLTVLFGNVVLYVLESRKRARTIKDFENNLINAIQGEDAINKPTTPKELAKVFPFKNPNPPKMN